MAQSDRINYSTASSFLIIVSANVPAAEDAWARQMVIKWTLGNLKEKCWLKNSYLSEKLFCNLKNNENKK